MALSQARWGLSQRLSVHGSLHDAAQTGDVACLEAYAQRGMDNGYPERVTLQIRDNILGGMPIHFASEGGHLHALKYLVNHQVDLDAGDSQMVTAMHLAAISNRVSCVNFLLKHSAKRSLPDSSGDTPLHWAATKGHVEVINILIDYENLDQPNLSGWTPLHRASYNGRIQACEALLNRGASLLSVDMDGNTPLHLACKANQIQTVEFLLTWEPNVELENHQGQQAADLCSPHYAAAVQSILADHSNGKLKSGFNRQDSRKAFTRTNIAPSRAKTNPTQPCMLDAATVSLPSLSLRDNAAGSFSLEQYPSFGHKDAQGFPLMLEEDGIHILPVPEEEEVKPDADQQSGRAESPSELEGGGAGAWSSTYEGDMAPWASEGPEEPREEVSKTEDCLASRPQSKHGVRDPRRSQSMIVGRQKKPNVQFLNKYNLQKYHLFSP